MSDGLNQDVLLALAAYELEPPVSFFPIGPGINNHSVGVHTARGDARGYQRCHTSRGWMSLTPLLPGICPEFRLIDGRSDTRDDLGRAPSRIEWVRTMKHWLDGNAGQLVDVIMREVC